jgi:hypothetical protein
MGVAEFLGGHGEEGLQQVLLVSAQRRGPPPPLLVLECRRVERLGVGFDPVVDTLSGDAEQAGDLDGGASLVELQDSKGTP